MAGLNRFRQSAITLKSGNINTTCVFISHRLADLDVAKAVGQFLTETVGVDIYLSDSDEFLQSALQNGDDSKIVEYLEKGLACSTHLLGIISNRTRNSWYVPFEFGAGRQRSLIIAQLLLEEVVDAPSYLKIADILRDSDDLSKWASKTISRAIKSTLPVPYIPRVASFKTTYPRWVKM